MGKTSKERSTFNAEPSHSELKRVGFDYFFEQRGGLIPERGLEFL